MAPSGWYFWLAVSCLVCSQEVQKQFDSANHHTEDHSITGFAEQSEHRGPCSAESTQQVDPAWRLESEASLSGSETCEQHQRKTIRHGEVHGCFWHRRTPVTWEVGKLFFPTSTRGLQLKSTLCGRCVYVFQNPHCVHIKWKLKCVFVSSGCATPPSSASRDQKEKKLEETEQLSWSSWLIPQKTYSTQMVSLQASYS